MIHRQGLSLLTPFQVAAIIMLSQSGTSPLSPGDAALSEIVVTGQRRAQAALAHAGNIERLDGELVDGVRHQHIHQLMTRVAGVWISRGSGQEHLTAIRSPVLTGAGSCGILITRTSSPSAE